MNSIRTGAGLRPVTNNSSWTLGIAHHLKYLENTPAAFRTGQYESAHTENPASPYYTSDGAAEGARSDLTFGTSSDLGAIDSWIEAPFHAIGMLRAGLTQVAFYRDAIGDAGLDVLSGLTGGGPTSPITFPGNGSSIDLPTFGGESPDPIQTCTKEHPSADYANAGLPLIALLPSSPSSTLTATLTSPNGTRTLSTSSDLCLIDEHNWYSTDTVYGPTGLEILQNDHAVLVVPRTPLVPGQYHAELSAPGVSAITWSFTFAGPPTTLWVSKPIIIAKGQSTLVAGHLFDTQTGQNIFGEPVTLYTRTSSTKPWVRIGSFQTQGNGIVTETVKPNYTAQMEWVYGGSSYHGKSVSPIATITIGIPPTTLTISKAVTIAKGTSIVVAGHLLDSQSHKNIAGAMLWLYSRTSSSRLWVKIGTRTSSSTGIVTETVTPNYSAQLEWVFHGSSIHASSISPTTILSVR